MHSFLQATCNNIQQEFLQSVQAWQHKDFSHVWAAGKDVINRDNIHQQEMNHSSVLDRRRKKNISSTGISPAAKCIHWKTMEHYNIKLVFMKSLDLHV